MPTHTPAEIVAILRAEGIPCEEHELGLAAHCRDPREYAKALRRCTPTILRVLTMEGDQGLDTHPSCSGTMTCGCKDCSDQRARLLKRGPIGSGPQPWERAERRELRRAA